MRMLLTSGGIANDAIRDALVDLIGRPTGESTIVVVIDGMLGFPGDKSTMLDHLVGLRALGWAEFDVMSLAAAPHDIIESRLRSADVVFCYGGSNHWLAHAWTANGYAPLLRELLDEKVYVGWSAGSMIFSSHHAAATIAIDDQDEVRMFGLATAAPALPLFDWWLMPHLNAPFFPDADDAWAAELAPRIGAPTWFLDDDAALVIRAAADPEPVDSGHWLRFDADGVLADSR